MAIFSWKLSILDRSCLKTVVKNAYCQIVGSASQCTDNGEPCLLSRTASQLNMHYNRSLVVLALLGIVPLFGLCFLILDN